MEQASKTPSQSARERIDSNLNRETARQRANAPGPTPKGATFDAGTIVRGAGGGMSGGLQKTSEPCVYKRPGGTYVVVYRDPTGKQRRRSAKSLTHARARSRPSFARTSAAANTRT